MLTSGWVVAAVEIALIAAAWGVNRRTPFAGGPLIVLRGMLGVAALSLLLIVAATMLEVPDSRGLFLFLALVAIGILIARSVQRRGRVRAAETAGYTVRTQPRRVTPAPSPLRPGYTSSSRTVRDIENMEVQ